MHIHTSHIHTSHIHTRLAGLSWVSCAANPGVLMNFQFRSSFLVRIASGTGLLFMALPSFGAEPAAVADSSALRPGLSVEEIVARMTRE